MYWHPQSKFWGHAVTYACLHSPPWFTTMPIRHTWLLCINFVDARGVYTVGLYTCSPHCSRNSTVDERPRDIAWHHAWSTCSSRNLRNVRTEIVGYVPDTALGDVWNWSELHLPWNCETVALCALILTRSWCCINRLLTYLFTYVATQNKNVVSMFFTCVR